MFIFAFFKLKKFIYMNYLRQQQKKNWKQVYKIIKITIFINNLFFLIFALIKMFKVIKLKIYLDVQYF